MRKLFISLTAAALLLAPACSNNNNTTGEEEAVPPALTTSDATAIFATGATLGGNVTTAGSPAFVERGVCYGPDENPTVSNNRTPVEGVDLGAFEVSVANLTEQTSYHARAYVNTPNGIVYGNDVQFNTAEAGTIAVQPALTTDSVSSITATTAIVYGNITNAGTPAYTERGVCYGKMPNPDTDAGAKRATSKATGTGDYLISLTGLDPNTTYYAKAYVICAGQLCYDSSEVQFVTSALEGPPVAGIYVYTLTLQLDAKQTATVNYSIIPLNAGNTKVSWSSSDPSVATVDAATGVITGVAVGTATITVTTDDGGFKTSCTVTVVAENLLVNPGFEDPDDGPTALTMPDNWTLVPAEWFQSYYGSANAGTAPSGLNPRAPLTWFSSTYPGMKPILAGNFTARVPGNASGGLYQIVTVTPGATYEYGCYIGFRDNSGNGKQSVNSDMAVKILAADGTGLVDSGNNPIGITYLSAFTPVITGMGTTPTYGQYLYYNDSNTPDNWVKGVITIPAGVTQVRFQVDQRDYGSTSPVMVWDECFLRQTQ